MTESKVKMHTYKVVYRYPDLKVAVLECISENRQTGYYETLKNDGTLLNRLPEEAERPNVFRLVLSLNENAGLGDRRERCFARVQFMDEDSEKKLTDAKLRSSNMAKRLAYDFLKRHNQVIVHDENGVNINMNIGGMPNFQLIDESAAVLNEVEKNKSMTNALAKITDIYENNREYFMDVCYAWGFGNVNNTDPQTLYNKACVQIKLNPTSFEKVIDSADFNVLSKVNKAIALGFIEYKNEYYYFKGEPIGKTLDEAISYFTLNENPRKHLFKEVGYSTHEESSTKEELQSIPPQNLGKGRSLGTDAKMVASMKGSVNAALNKYYGKDEEKLAGIMEKIRADYEAISELVEQYYNSRLAEVKEKP